MITLKKDEQGIDQLFGLALLGCVFEASFDTAPDAS
jgi:hypothetical protein